MKDYLFCSDTIVRNDSQVKWSGWSGKTGGAAFIDLFCGIGGFHLAMKHASSVSGSSECVLACEINEHARKTYSHNFGGEVREFPDDVFNLLKDDHASIPAFDVICAGFPCQPFSQAGHRKGFDDIGRGNLFYELARLLYHRRPIAFLFENVKHIKNHDNGRTWMIIETIVSGLGYSMTAEVLKATDYGVPQNRPRTYMVGFRKDAFSQNAPGFVFPHKTPEFQAMIKASMPSLLSIFQAYGDTSITSCDRSVAFTLRCGGAGSNIDDRHNWDSYRVQRHEHAEKEVFRINSKVGTALMGLPSEFSFPDSVSERQRMRQLGNSIAVPAAKHVAKAMIRYVEDNALMVALPNIKRPLSDNGYKTIISDSITHVDDWIKLIHRPV